MRNILFILCFSLSLAVSLAQSGSYYHDPALDTIAGGVANSAMTHDFFLPIIASNTAKAGGMTTTQMVEHAERILGVSSIIGYSNFSQAFDENLDYATNFGGALGGSGTGSWSHFYPEISSVYITNQILAEYHQGTIATPLDSASIITLGTFNGVTYHLNLKLTTGDYLSTSFCATVRAVISSVIWFLFFVLGNKALQDQISILLNQRQIQGSTQSALGSNLSGLTATVYIAFFSTTLYFLAAKFSLDGVLGFFLGGSTTGAAVHDSVWHTPYFITWLANAWAVIPAWDVLTSLCPIADIAGAWVAYMSWTKVTMWPVFLGLRTTILFFAS